MATSRGENFDEFAHSSREISKRALPRDQVLYDSWAIRVLLDTDIVSYITRMASRAPFHLRQWLCPIRVIQRGSNSSQRPGQTTKNNPLEMSPKSLFNSRTL